MSLISPKEAHAATASTGVESIFGPKKYIRTTGKPNTYTDSFSIPGFSSNGTLIIKNGDDNGRHRISSALVYLNGIQILGPNNLNQQVGMLEFPVSLSNANTIQIELRSKPEGYLIIDVINYLPLSDDQVLTTEEDTAIGVILSASDAESQTLSYTVAASPSHGTLAGNPPHVTYTPAADYYGPDAFTFTASDGASISKPGTINITVTPVNDPPQAHDDTAFVDEDTITDIQVLSNDVDVDGDPLSVAIVSPTTHGTVVANSNGACTYTPAPNFSGQDSFTYRITDTYGVTSHASVYVTVNPINDSPIAIDDTAQTDEDTVVDIVVLANDTDVDGDTLSVTAVSQGTNGAVTINPDGTVRYTPYYSFFGQDSFNYTVSDGNGATSQASVSVTVNPINDAPVAIDDTAQTDEDTAVDIGVLSNDTDEDGDTLSVTSVSQGTNGAVAINLDGTVRYTPNSNFYGQDGFNYTVSDGNGGMDTAAVNLAIIPVNDSPTANNDSTVTDEDIAVTTGNLLLNDIDVDGDALIIVSFTQPANGTVTDNGDGTFTYTPQADFFGQDSFSYTISDNNGGTASASVMITVNAVNDPPVITVGPLTYQVNTGELLTINVSGTDPEDDLVTLSAGPAINNATFTSTPAVNPTGVFSFTPDASQVGTYAVTFTATDGKGGSDTQSFTIIVTMAPLPSNNPPVADAGNDATYLMLPGQAMTVNLDGSKSNDSDGTIVSYVWTGTPDPDDVVQPAVLLSEGSHTFNLVVTDDDGAASAPDTVTVTVTLGNSPPAINPVADQAMDENTTLTVGLSSSDPDGDALSLSILGLPSFASFTDNGDGTGSIVVSPSFDDAGTYPMIAVASDGNLRDSDSFTLTVNNVNRPPIANTGGPYQGVIGVPIALNGSLSSDPDGDPLTYLWNFGDGSVDQSGVQVMHPYGQTGSYQVTLTVDDGQGGSDTDTVSMIITPPPEIDLEPVFLDTSGLSVDSQTLAITGTVYVDIQNNGINTAAASYDVAVFEDRNGNQLFDPGIDIVFGTATVASGPDGGDSISVPVTMNGNVLFVNNLIYAYVDSGKAIQETNEDNNVTSNMTDCQYIPPVGSFNPVLEWAWTSSNIAPTYYQVDGIPVVINLNDDNADGFVDEKDIPDIVFSTYPGVSYNSNGKLRAISGDGSGELFTINNTSYETNASASPAAGDIDGDGLPEIIAVHEGDQKVLAFENDGTFKWRSSDQLSGNAGSAGGSLYYPSVVISDIDEDGSPEIIVGRLVLNNDGTTKWIGTAGYGLHNSCVANLDLQGQPELVAGNTAYRADGSIYWQNASVPEGFSAVGNFDNDPYPEIVVSGNRNVYLLEHTGQIKWGPKNLPGGGYGGPATIADYDNDGEPEIGIAGYSSYMVFETDGSLKWQTSTSDVSSNITGSSVFDFEGDGSAEVLYADEYYLRVYRGSDGFVLFEYEVGSRTRIEYPVIADVDNDNNAEIIVATNNDYYHGPNHGIMVFGDANDTWVNTRKIWNQHAYSITNVNDDGTIPQHPANNWEIFNNFRQNEMLDPFGCNDLTASYVRIDDANLPNSIDILARIGNGGALHIAPGTSVAFYQGDPQGGGALLGTVTINRRLYPGEYEEVSFTLASPSSGMYPFYVAADDDGAGIGKVAEINEGNNKAHTFYHLNFSPGITSQPVISGVEGQPYAYDVEATDPEGDVLTYSLTTFPAGMAIDSATGLIAWTPNGTQAGSHSVEVLVSDGQGNSVTQVFAISVAEAVNTPPAITSSPILTVFDVGDYAYQVVAQDLDGDLLSFALTTAPAGMTISSGGLISWPQDPARPDPADVTVLVTDGRGGADTQSWQIAIVPVPPPQIAVTATPDPATLGDTVIIQLNISSYLGVTDMTVAVNGTPVPVVNGQASYQTSVPGNYTVDATATNVQGSIGTASISFLVIDPNDNQPPVISVSLPPSLTVKAPYQIIGTICDPALIGYDIELAPQGSSQYRVIASGTACVQNGVLGVLDPTLLANGLYNLRLTAYDANGNISSGQTSEPIEISGKLKIGQFSLAFEDLTIPVSGIPITVMRTYNSFDKEKGDFGMGWDMYLGSGVKIQVTRPLGDNWQAQIDHCFQWFYGQCMAWVYKLVTPNVPKVLVTYADGRQDRFEFTPVFSTRPALDPEWATAAFTPLQGTTSSLEVVGMPDLILLGGLTGNTLYDSDLEIFNPDLFRLTTAEGMILIISRSEGLKSMTDLNGNTLTFGPNGVTHSSGLGINIVRDSDGRITQITDPLGYQVSYGYDGNGDLSGFTDQAGNVTSYGYDAEHNLVSVIDPRGIQVLQTTYDAQGRMIGTVDGLGNTTSITHDMGNAVEYVTDRNGYTTEYEYDSDGNVISITDPQGRITSYTYDVRGNELSKTDALGNVTTSTYDSRNNKLTETGPIGSTATWTYNNRNQVLTTTDPLGNVTANAYDGRGNLLSKTDALGSVTTYTYDSSGNRLTMTDCEGNIWTYTYDARGNKLTETDPLGNVNTFTYNGNGNIVTETDPLGNTTTKDYDRLGRLIQTTDPLGNVTTTEYNSLGKKSAVVDKNGNRTEYEYDANGNLTLPRYPDGTTEANAYDANGNRITFVDRAGRITQYQYDELKYGGSLEASQSRLIGIIYPDGSSTGIEYDAVGRITATIDENGNRTESEYDTAGRVTRTTDAQGHITTFTYDANGNQTSMTNASGNTTIFEYDSLKRRTRTIYADGTQAEVIYAPGCGKERKLAEIDQAGNTTWFDYDPLGRLIQVTDAMGNVTAFSYDANGNKLTQTDANGNTTTWTFDSLGRVLSRTLPMGQMETYNYDANGNVLSKTDFNGDTISYNYNSINRLISKQYPDGSSVSFAYTPTGRRETETDPRGVTVNAYDLRDRLLSVTNPDGDVIAYTYDAKGNRTSVTVPSGTTLYTYDALNRPITVTDPDGGITVYTYDIVGNRSSVTYPNGTVADYTYDTLNRLIFLENRKSSGQTLSSYTYTLGPAGNRLNVTEDTGRSVSYTYDSLYRLIREQISDPVLGNETIAYTYDAFGNRLTRSDSIDTITYTYNANDQLVMEETGTGVTTIYTYDSNGNTISKSDGTTTITYGYDYENRLISAQEGSTRTDYEYDSDSIRTLSDNDGVVTYYLVDKNRAFAQVLEERDAGNSLIVSYIFGDDLISQNRGVTVSYYHYDGQMSTRKLTDNTETVTDSYIYDAFGLLLDQTGPTENNYGYTGEQYDPNMGFYYLRARYYDQNTGRFLTHDPILGSSFEPVSLHRYIYANGNPVINLDPSGRMTLVETMTVVGIIGVLASAVMVSFSHILSIDRLPLEWTGKMLALSADIERGGRSVPISIVYVDVESQCVDNAMYERKMAKGRFLLIFTGRAFSLDTSSITTVNPVVSDITLLTPGLLGPKAKFLSGPTTSIGLTVAIGPGLSQGVFSMGVGAGEVTWMPSVVWGLSIGGEFLGGISIPIHLPPLMRCP